MSWDITVDVLCVGSGAGGLSAAISAAHTGAQVLVVEKDAQLGGVTGISSGQCWVGANSLAAEAGIADSWAETEQYLEHLSQGLGDAALRQVFMAEGINTIDFLRHEAGIPFKVVKNYPDYYYPAVVGSKPEGRYLEVAPFKAEQLGDWADKCIVTDYGLHYAYTSSQEWVDHQAGEASIWPRLEAHIAADERCAGAGLAGYMVNAALDRGVSFMLSSPAIELIASHGEVTGAIIDTPDGRRRVRAKAGVLLATGGYDWNRDMVQRYEALTEFGSMCPPTVEGDHLTMAAGVGAIPYASRAPSQTPIFIGYSVPSERIYNHPSYRMLLPGAPHSMIVNRRGQRFANDSFYPDVATKVARFDGQEEGMPNWPAWLVFDQNMLDKYGLLPFFPGQPLPEDMAVSAESLAELAAELGIDAQGLGASVSRFNQQCISGRDDDFKRGEVPWGKLMTGDPRLTGNHNMAPLTTAPFYAVKLERVVMGVTTAGLKINHHAQVINARGSAIKGLYAAGNSAAQIDMGGGYNSGIANTRGLVQGRLAALHMLGDR